MYDVTQSPYNAVGDGVADDRAAIQAAIDDAEAAGGGVVYLPKGTYLLATQHPTISGTCLNVDGDDVTITGDGRGVTIIKAGTGVNATVINYINVSNCQVTNLEINANWPNNAAGHGLRSGGDMKYCSFKDLYIHDVPSYGIGLQYGTITGMVIDSVWIERTGSDGIDIKNKNHDSRENKMSNITVREAGFNTTLSTQACIDLRGVWHLVNIDCSQFYNDGTNGRCSTGIRFRTGEVTDVSGTGAHYSSLANFRVVGGSEADTIGVDAGAYQCQISNGVVNDCGIGYQVGAVENTITGCLALGCGTDGFVFNEGSDRSIAGNCIARGNGDSGFRVLADYIIIDSVVARSNSIRGLNIRSTANHTSISGVSTSNGAALYNVGTNTHDYGLVT